MVDSYEATPQNATLRDQFAMAALTGLMSAYGYTSSDHAKDIAKAAYCQAAAMLKEREK